MRINITKKIALFLLLQVTDILLLGCPALLAAALSRHPLARLANGLGAPCGLDSRHQESGDLPLLRRMPRSHI